MDDWFPVCRSNQGKSYIKKDNFSTGIIKLVWYIPEKQKTEIHVMGNNSIKSESRKPKLK